MAEIGLTAPSPFLSTPGDPSIPWNRWIEQFDTYLLASGISGNRKISVDRKRAILVHCLGTEGQRIFRSLEDTDSYEDAVTALEKQFGSHRSVIMERWHFRHREQRSGETTRQFITALSELAATCRFGDLTNELVRDQLIEKTCHQRIRERLLMEADTLTLQKATTLAVHIEEAMFEAKTIQTKPIENRTNVQTVGRKPRKKTGDSNDRQQRVCYNCGSPSHLANSDKCKARGKKCDSCGKMNHFAKMCHSKSETEKMDKTPVKMVNTDGEQNSEADYQVFSVNSKQRHFKTCDLFVGGQPIKLLMDIGAKVSILNETVYKSTFPDYKLHAAKQTLLNYDDGTLDILGMVYLNVEYDGQIITDQPFYVSRQGACLMGLDLFDALEFEVVRHGARVQTVETVPADVMQKFPDVFSGFGMIKSYCHKPKVNPEVPPVSQRLRRIPLAVRDEVATELRRLEHDGIIEKIDSSPWISNLVIARRKSGEIRLCVDLKAVNKAIFPDRYPLPTMEELAAEFHGSTVFTKLDLRRSYLQVNLKEESRQLTAFVTHIGVFQYRRMPYGLSSSPSAFQKILSSILSGLDGAPNQMDDIVVHGKDQAEHDSRLNKVLQKLTDHNITLNGEKCKFSAEEVNFLGYRVSASGIQPTASNVAAILNLKEPTNRAEMSSFLGTTNFYLKFVPNYADKAEPLRRLLRKDAKWQWGDSQQCAFNELKEAIASPPILSHFDPDAETFVSSDASGIALGAVLSQVTKGVERPVAFCSRTLTETERKYSTGEREALGCVYACEHWHVYLFGRKFTLRTDHQALTTLLATSGTGHRPLRIYRWSDRLYQYNFDVQYTSGKDNHVPDMLSRLVFDSVSSDAEEMSAQEESCVMAVLCGSLEKLVTPSELKVNSEEDPILTQVRGYIQNGWPSSTSEELKVFAKLKDELFIFNSSCVGRGERAVIPDALQQRVLHMAHDGHPGIVRMKEKCRVAVWWPGIDRQIEQFVKDCEACVLSEKSIKPVSPPAQSIPWPEKPWQQIQIDIFGAVQVAPHNKRFLVVVHDLHSKWPEIAATGSVTSASVIDILINLFTRWGLPEVLISDNGPQFVSHEFEQFLCSLGIEHRRTSRYNPQSNGGIERFNRVIKEGLKANMAEGQSFAESIQTILLNYRGTPHALTSKAPAELMLGRSIRLPLDRLKPSTNQGTNQEEVSEQASVISRRQAKSRAYTDAHRANKTPTFKVGDWVRIKRPNLGHKLHSSLSDPKQVKRQLSKYSYRLCDGTSWNARRLIPTQQESQD